MKFRGCRRMNKTMKSDKKALLPRLRFPEFRDAGTWAIKPLGKILSIGNGKDHKHLSDGGIPVYGSGGYMRSVNDYLYSGESVCIGRKGTIDKPVFLEGKFWTVDTLFYTHSFKGSIPKFVFVLFQNIEWLKHNEAGGVPSLSKTNIEKIQVPIPEVKEQQKIADFLSSIDALIAAQADKVDALKTHKKSLVNQLFPREGETVPRLRFPEFRGAEEWEEKKLGDIAKLKNGYAFKSFTYAESGQFRIVTIANVQSCWLNLESTKYIADLPKDVQEHQKLRMGDILISMTGNVGRVCRVTEKNLLLNQRVGKLIANEINEKFLYQLLLREKFRSAMQLNAAGGAQGNLSSSTITSYGLSLPSDQTEQQRIADCLCSLDALIAAHSEKLDALKTHKKGLMQQLLPSLEGVDE